MNIAEFSSALATIKAVVLDRLAVSFLLRYSQYTLSPSSQKSLPFFRSQHIFWSIRTLLDVTDWLPLKSFLILSVLLLTFFLYNLECTHIYSCYSASGQVSRKPSNLQCSLTPYFHLFSFSYIFHPRLSHTAQFLYAHLLATPVPFLITSKVILFLPRGLLFLDCSGMNVLSFSERSVHV